MVQGLERVRLLDLVGTEPYLVARVEAAPEQSIPATEVTEVEGSGARSWTSSAGSWKPLPDLPDALGPAVEGVDDPRHLVYFVASVVPLDAAARQELLEMDAVPSKLRRLIDLLQRDLAVRELGRKITTDTEERLSKRQREFYLREQLRSIQQELGEEDASGHPGRRAPPEDRGGRPSRGGPARGRARADPARDRPADLAGARHDRHVSRVDGEPALEQGRRRGHRHPPRPRGAGRGPLRPGEGQGSDPRVPGGEEAPPGAHRAERARRRTGDHPRPPSRRA